MKHYPHHIGDFNNATRHLTRVERSVYRDAIEHYYDTEEPLSAADLARLERRLLIVTAEEKEALAFVLNEFFTKTEDGWSNKHCDLKIKAYKNQKKANKNNGKAGGRPKKQKITESVTDGLPFVTLTTNNKQETKNKDIKDDRFDIFWKQYPRKVAKPNALKAWLKIKPDDVVLKKMLDAINHQQLPSKEIQFVPHPASWLNAKRWEDEITAPTTNVMNMGRRIL